MTEFLWRDGIPDFSLLWLSEPDFSQHNFAPGSPEALSAIKAADADLATVLSALDKNHARNSTDVLVVSDHGFSTIRRSVKLIALLNAAGLHASTALTETPKPGDILVAGNGGTVLFYVQNHAPDTVQRLVTWLQQSDFASVIFTRDKLEGVFPLDAAHLRTAAAPDVIAAFRSYPDKNQFGVPGMIDADWNRPAGEGTHATLGPTDVQNTLIAAGPDFPGGAEEALPTGNIDIAPTVLAILGVTARNQMDGRNLLAKTAAPVRKHLGASRTLDHGNWKQTIDAVSIGDTTYFEPATASPIANHQH